MRSVRIAMGAIAFVGMLLGGSLSAQALVDDLEDDLWTGFTHFHLGDRATAGYSTAYAKSGTRSYHVAISGWTVRDFGSAFGYAFFPTRKAPVTELRLSLLYERLEDTVASTSDAFAAGVSIDLFDGRLRSVGSARYVTEYKGSRVGGRCAPTTSDVVLGGFAGLGTWSDIGRDPAADFPSAPWATTEFVRISIGFLCAAGLTGASYSLYFDDFFLDTGAGDSDGDGLRDLEEEARVYSARVSTTAGPRPLPPGQDVGMDLGVPSIAGDLASAAIELEIDHAHIDDLSVELRLTGANSSAQLLWDPGVQARGAAILTPSNGSSVRGTVEVRGRAWRPDPAIDFYVDDVLVTSAAGDSKGAFTLSWNSEGWQEGTHRIFVVGRSTDGSETRTSKVTTVIVDRTPPDLLVLSPHSGDTLSGLTLITAGVFDRHEVGAVALWIDGVQVDSRDDQLYVFPFDTLDLSNDVHTFEVRATDAAGNQADRSISVRVNNKATAPPPCSPKCNTGGAASTGNLPPILRSSPLRVIPLPSGNRLEVSEGFRVPWRPSVTRTEMGVHLILDAMRPPRLSESEGLIGSNLTAAAFAGATSWRVVIHSHRSTVGSIRSVSALLALRTFPGVSDTDRDGLADGVEWATLGTVPVLPDTDGDALRDGQEAGPRFVRFSVDGATFDRFVQTDPLDFDTDNDGLADGLELLPNGANQTDPTDADTDDDGLSDGAERLLHASDPTLTDTDGDTLSDYREAMPHALPLILNGVSVNRYITTSPTTIDSDGDGLTDPQEWGGSSLYTFNTDPSDDDTDDDGLSDNAEVTSLAGDLTSPVDSDSDRDGIIDGLDLAPVHAWNFRWSAVYETGLLRFDQNVHALGAHGVAASVFNYNLLSGKCEFIADEVAAATRDSDESTNSAMGQMNQVFSDGGETAFRAISVGSPELLGWGPAEFVYGACDAFHPKKYVITYTHDDHVYPMEFVNVQPYALRDDAGDPYYHAVVDVPLNASRSQSIVIQVKIRADADRASTTLVEPTVLPGLTYVLSNGRDFYNVRPFYRNLAVGASLDEHVYEFTLRVPASTVPASNLFLRDGALHATLVVTPVWLTGNGTTSSKAALNATAMTVGAAVVTVSENAERLVVRLSRDVNAIRSVLPSTIATYETGYYTIGTFSVYVYRLGTSFDGQSLTQADAVYVIGGSQEDIETFQGNLTWTPSWRIRVADGFGNPTWVFKAIRFSLSFSRKFFDGVYEPVPDFIYSNLDGDRFNTASITVERTHNLDTLSEQYLVSVRVVKIGQSTSPHPEFPWITRTEEEILNEDGISEIVDDPNKASILADSRYASIRSGLRGASAGAVAVIWGSQAVLAYRDGNVVKGTVYLVAGAAGVFGILKSDVVLFDVVLQGTQASHRVRVKLGTALAIATGGILAGYELYLSTQTNDPIKKLSHYEAAAATVGDTAISLIPFYGPIFELSWVLTTVGIAALGPLLGYVPDSLALKIVSSPGSTITFLVEYFFTSGVPSEIAQDALNRLLNFLAEMATSANALANPPMPTIVLFPSA